MDIGERQRKLSLWAEQDKEHQFFDLYGLLYNKEWLQRAYQNVKQNSGSKTAGVDGMVMQDFTRDLEENLENLRQALKDKRFKPFPVRREYIPKINGKVRPLGIPAIKDRIVQEALRMILEPIFEADFSQHSYGFRPNRCTMDAIAYIGARLTGKSGKTYQWAIEGDIASFFDTIAHQKLMKCVKRRIKDRNILDLTWKFLRAGVLEKGQYRETLTGTPQGGIISPLLANIYLTELDRYMEQCYLSLSYSDRAKRRREGKANFLYVRYADDFVVLSNGTKEQTIALKQELYGFLKVKLKVDLSLEKTKVTHITEGFKFLGYWIERSVGISGKVVPKFRIPEEALQRIRNKVREALDPTTTQHSFNAKILATNSIIGGWCRYYQYTSSPSYLFSKLDETVFWLMAHWLGRKYKISIPKALGRYHKGAAFVTNSKRLIMPKEYKAKRYKLSVKHNPYTVPNNEIWHEQIDILDNEWMGTEERPGMADLRDEVETRQGRICQECGKQLRQNDIEADHKKPRRTFKHPQNADYLENIQILCKPCHKAKTESDRLVLSRVP